MKKGLLPLSQEAMLCGKCSYHDYQGILVDDNEKEMLARNLGPNNKVMFLRNHGVVICGSTIEETFHLVEMVVRACENQVILQSHTDTGQHNIWLWVSNVAIS